MYRCKGCGHVFEDGEQAIWAENHGCLNGVAETFSGCPICHDGFEEVSACKVCGSICEEKNDKYCKECKKDVKTRFKKLMDRNFNDDERELLNELYDGEEL